MYRARRDVSPWGQIREVIKALMGYLGKRQDLSLCLQGVAKVAFETTALSLGRGANSVLDRSLIVHRDPDDYKTRPTGNAGPRSACVVIRKA